MTGANDFMKNKTHTKRMGQRLLPEAPLLGRVIRSLSNWLASHQAAPATSLPYQDSPTPSPQGAAEGAACEASSATRSRKVCLADFDERIRKVTELLIAEHLYLLFGRPKAPVICQSGLACDDSGAMRPNESSSPTAGGGSGGAQDKEPKCK